MNRSDWMVVNTVHTAREMMYPPACDSVDVLSGVSYMRMK